MSHELYQKLSGSFHHECPMNAIYFIDKAPEAALPLPALTFADNPSSGGSTADRIVGRINSESTAAGMR
jgi:hypothetical protein